MPADQLFIPKRIKVGYQRREDTYTKKLAYIIYYDNKGVLRKETSWRSWCQLEKYPPEEYDNVPSTGFVLNKDVKRSSEWFGSGRNMIRIYDERGMEFEITTSNLLFILMTTNCHKRGLEGEFVYAWNGTELVLLPTDCDQYRSSVQFTDLQHQKIAAKDLVIGGSYKNKQQKDFIYLGRFPWYTMEYANKHQYSAPHHGLFRIESMKKHHIFVDSKGSIRPFSSLTSLAVENTNTPVSNYADLIDKFNKMSESSKVVKFKEYPFKLDFGEDKDHYGYRDRTINAFKKIEDNHYRLYRILRQYQYRNVERDYNLEGYFILPCMDVLIKDGVYQEWGTGESEQTDRYNSYSYSYGRYYDRPKIYQRDYILEQNYIDIKTVDDNGNINNIYY